MWSWSVRELREIHSREEASGVKKTHLNLPNMLKSLGSTAS